MNLELNDVEAGALREGLQTVIKGLVSELAHADQRQYREMLRHKLERYETLAARLEERLQPSGFRLQVP